MEVIRYRGRSVTGEDIATIRKFIRDVMHEKVSRGYLRLDAVGVIAMSPSHRGVD